MADVTLEETSVAISKYDDLVAGTGERAHPSNRLSSHVPRYEVSSARG
jgi:hypothetical protein